MEQSLEKRVNLGEMLVKIEPYVLNETHMKKVEERMNRLYESIVTNKKEERKEKFITKPSSPVNNLIKEPPLCDMV